MLCSKESNPRHNGNKTHLRFPAMSIERKKLKMRAKLRNKKCIGELDGNSRETKNHSPFLWIQTTWITRIRLNRRRTPMMDPSNTCLQEHSQMFISVK